MRSRGGGFRWAKAAELLVEFGGSASGSTASRARRPRLSAFFAVRALPSGARGPVDCLAFLRLALI